MPDARSQRRYIRSQVPQVTRVTWTPDETIRLALRDGRRYTMQIGSDDEVYHFVNDTNPQDVLRFPVEEE